MNILVLCPMQTECDNFKSALANFPEHRNHYKVVETGVGKVDAAATAALEVYSGQYDLVTVIGYAAGGPYYNQGDIVLPSSTCYSDVNVPKGLVPELEQVYELQGSDDCICLTADEFILEPRAKVLEGKYGKAVIYDMESAAVAQVCAEANVPVLTIKYISDIPNAGDHSDNYLSFTDFVSSHSDFTVFVNYLEQLGK